MDNLASIKTHDPCRAGVLVELSGEFDVSCWEAFRYALRKAASLGQPIFVDLSGVTFMDSLHIRELAIWATMGAAPLRLCRPSWQAELSVAACDLEDGIVILPDDDPGYEAVVTEACRFRGPAYRRRDGSPPERAADRALQDAPEYLQGERLEVARGARRAQVAEIQRVPGARDRRISPAGGAAEARKTDEE